MTSTDEEWFKSLVERFQTRLISYAFGYLKNTEKAREVVQETFMKLCVAQRDRVEPYISQWLYTVCRNLAIDLIRKDSRVTSLDNMDTVKDESLSSADSYSTQECGAKAMKLLSDLPENQREVIRLKFQHGLSYQEIATITHLSVSNVGFLLHTAIKHLKKNVVKKGGMA